MSTRLLLRPLVEADVPRVSNLPPEDWHFDFSELLRLHLNKTYFYPVVGESKGEVVAVGHGIQSGETGWLGNIIVAPGHRRQGFGATLTTALIEILRSAGCRRQLLIATRQGEPVYAKLGFRVTGQYVFFKPRALTNLAPHPNISALKDSDLPMVLRLDHSATSENRAGLLSRFLSEGVAYRSKGGEEIRGFCLPRFGAGLVVAKDRAAGEALLLFKHGSRQQGAVVPEDNSLAVTFFETHGFEESMRAPRMVLGADDPWLPRMIWSRAAGYCG
jgi:GNAT superfamily N-acetyltransferase